MIFVINVYVDEIASIVLIFDIFIRILLKAKAAKVIEVVIRYIIFVKVYHKRS